MVNAEKRDEMAIISSTRIKKEEEFYPRLCGSTLFFTVLRLKKSRTGKQEKCFKDFLEIIDPASVDEVYCDSLHKYASDCRNAKELPKEGDYVRFGNADVCAAFRDEFKNNQEKVMKRIKTFVDTYFVESSHPLLVRALMELIEADKYISEHNRGVYINPEFIPSYKDEFLKEDATIYFYNFLLGVFYYVYEYSDGHEMGKATIESWTEKTKEFAEDKTKTVLGNSRKYDGITILYDTEKINDEGLVYEEGEASPIAIMDPNGIAEDLGFINPETGAYVLEAVPVKAVSDKYSKYVKKAFENYSYKKTFLYDVPRAFRDFYVCNDIRRRVRSVISFTDPKKEAENQRQLRNHSEPIKKDIKVDDFEKHNNIIIGNGGLGKSMMMNKFMLDEAENYSPGRRVPIFITLRSYKPDEKSIQLLLSNELKRFDPELQLSDLYSLLAGGRLVCLLDGLDEVKKEYICEFQDELDSLVDAYLEIVFIVSSRDIPEVRTLNNFYEFELMCFSQEQAFEMVKRLDPLAVDDELKKCFISDIKRDKFNFSRDEKESFLGNPLFLTITLLTYARNNEIPKKRYLFYEKAYIAMASEYDSKTKRITRAFFTGLDEKGFQKYFADFCALSYADSNYEFDRDELAEYFQQVIDDNGLKTTAEMFIKDATEKICLMYKDGDTYCFIHRSFQEYFAAYFFLTLLDSDFDIVYQTLMHLDNKIKKDEILSMLHGMDNGRMEKLIILPFLNEMFGYNIDDADYKDFIKRYYPMIEYVTGDLDEDMCDLEPQSALFCFIKNNYPIKDRYISVDFNNCPDYADDYVHYYFVDEIWFNECEHIGNVRIVEESSIPWRLKESGEDIDDLEGGYLCSVDACHVLDHPESNEVAFDIITASNFALREMFDSFKELYISLQQKYDENAKSKVRRLGLRKN